MINGKLRIKPLCVAAALSTVGLGLGIGSQQEYASAAGFWKHNKITIVNNSGEELALVSYGFNARGMEVADSHGSKRLGYKTNSNSEKNYTKTFRCHRRKSKRNNNTDYCNIKIMQQYFDTPVVGKCKVRNGNKYEIVKNSAPNASETNKLICNQV